ncbi:GTPase Era [Marinicauda pacifica]|jgi:GTPase|uniref:GTPase Era n=3 Tax=Marinicauda pacifica TaxID=1133559 RepID=A0A4S2HFJ7_9PROT|nr:GTPase Era [Marinicauda pacifica]
MQMTDNPTRAGFAAIIGAPNAGKSTLVNQLVGRKVSIVTHKVQTTRFQVRGVAIVARTQIVLVDTPGVFAPRRRLDRAMVAAAWAGADDADVIVHVVDAPAQSLVFAGKAKGQDARSGQDVDRVIEGLRNADRKAVLALNKIDGMKREELFVITQTLFESGVYDEVFMISALKGDGTQALGEHLAKSMPEGPWLYPEDQIADLPERLLAAEVTREKLFLRVHDELPYNAMVETETWEEHRDGSVKIDQAIILDAERHKPIVVGKGGAVIKEIGQKAREELQDQLGRKVHLFLRVIVKPGWQEQRGRYTSIGLDFEA